MLRIDASALDYAIIGLYFVTVLGVGLLARRLIKTDLDFFLSGRSLPAWITGLAFIAANLGALEILGMAANGAQKLFGWFGAHGIEGTAAGYERMGLAPGQVQRLARAQPRDGVGRLRPGRHRRRG